MASVICQDCSPVAHDRVVTRLGALKSGSIGCCRCGNADVFVVPHDPGILLVELDVYAGTEVEVAYDDGYLAGMHAALVVCDCDEPDGPCEACDEPHGHTCRACDYDWCQACWGGFVHADWCPVATREERAG